MKKDQHGFDWRRNDRRSIETRAHGNQASAPFHAMVKYSRRFPRWAWICCSVIIAIPLDISLVVPLACCGLFHAPSSP
jgi:hypothetical protein